MPNHGNSSTNNLSSKIDIGKVPPPKNYVLAGNIVSMSNGRCGSYDARQSIFDDLRTKALALNGDYIKYNEYDFVCGEDGYELSAEVYTTAYSSGGHKEFDVNESMENYIRFQKSAEVKSMSSEKCKELGFKVDTEAMSFCLLKQQELQVLKEQQEEKKSNTVTAGHEHESSHDSSQESLELRKLEIIQKGVQDAFRQPIQTKCTSYGNTTNCTSY